MCTQPMTAHPNPTGGRPIFGHEGKKQGLPEIQLPCGKCPECQKSYYTDWATRGSRELQRWETSVFITLTYSDDHLPKNGSLSKKEMQKFLKRLKKHFKSTKQNPIRQSYCGEYGEKTKRPHYHAILYNCDFRDRRHHYTSEQGHKVFTSETLSQLWPYGHSEFGYAQPGSIAYLYKYILKKKFRREKQEPLKLIMPDGEIREVEHEFIESSRNPGIGAHMRQSQSIKKGYLSVDGVKKKLPKYYLEFLKINDVDTYEKITDGKFEFHQSKPKESSLRRKQKQEAQKLLTDTKKKL